MLRRYQELLELYQHALTLTGDTLKEFLEANSLQRGICFYFMGVTELSDITKSYFYPPKNKESKFIEDYCIELNRPSITSFPYSFIGGWKSEKEILDTIRTRITHLHTIIDKLKHYYEEPATEHSA